jgi:hypothetical protein
LYSGWRLFRSFILPKAWFPGERDLSEVNDHANFSAFSAFSDANLFSGATL